MHTEISPDSELRLTITVRDSVAGLHAVLIFDDKKFKKNMTGIVDSEAFKLWVEVVSDEYHKEKDLTGRTKMSMNGLKIL